MIDPKLDKLPAERADQAKQSAATSISEDQARTGQERARQGLSIQDTVAGDTTLSVGGRGVDTSGVGAGSGAGSGSINVSPGATGSSPAPAIVPGARGSGTTPRATGSSGQSPSLQLEPEEGGTISSEEIAARAYRCWHERGCPVGSPEIDWHRAETELRTERRGTASRSVATSA